MDPNSREHEREAIDAEINSLEESILALKHHRNALAPISSLPSEVFAAIFSFLRVTASAFTPGQKTDPLAWLRVAHVCHKWREIALNQPLFWSHVNFTTLSSAGAAEIIARSKKVPLHLEARALGSDWDNTRYSAFQEKLQMCISRTCHLFISANSSHPHKTLDSLVSPAPNPESLSLYSEQQLFQPRIPDTLFGGTAPRLSCLKLRNYLINCNSPLLKGLKTLEIRSACFFAKQSLSVWLDVLEEMPQLKMLTLHVASPIPNPLPFNIERSTVTLPSLTHLDIDGSPRNCGFVLAHLDLPALNCLCLQTFSSLRDSEDVQKVLPYVAQYARTKPLRSMLIRGKNRRMDIVAWPVPDTDVEVHEPPTLPTTTPSAHLALSISSPDWIHFNNHLEFFGSMMAALPLDRLVTLIADDFVSPAFEKFWHHNSLKWPLLRRVRLTPFLGTKFVDRLLEDNGGREDPLLPSLKELVLVDAELDEHLTLDLYDALKMRVGHGVPLEMLDLRTCLSDPDNPGAVDLLREIGVDVLGPEESFEAKAQIRSTWDRFDHGPFINDENSGEFDTNDDDDDSDTSGDSGSDYHDYENS